MMVSKLNNTTNKKTLFAAFIMTRIETAERWIILFYTDFPNLSKTLGTPFRHQ